MRDLKKGDLWINKQDMTSPYFYQNIRIIIKRIL